MSIKINEVGNRYGALLVLAEAELKHTSRKRAAFSCICDCGNLIIVTGENLRSGNSKTCGCKRIENSKSASITHNDSKSAEYKIYHNIKRRCYDQKTAQYKNYGGRGIKMCDEWLCDYKNFLADMGRRPSNEHSIDRIDNDGNYEPNNCRWATDLEQAQNTTRTVKYLINGNLMLARDICNAVGIKQYQFAYQHYTLKLTGEQIFNKFKNRTT